MGNFYPFVFTVFRYKIVIHEGVDGYSHLIVFLKAATNNLHTTVLEDFVNAT